MGDQSNTNLVLDNSFVQKIEHHNLIDDGKTPLQLAHELYTEHAHQMMIKGAEKHKNIEERVEQVKFVHALMRDIRNAQKEDDSLDITQNVDLQNKLKKMKEFGIDIRDDKTKFSPLESKRLIENLNSAATDWDTDNNIWINEVQKYYKESEQSILIAKNVLSSDDRAKRGAISGIRGS